MAFICMGGFAEEVIADASQIIPIPHTLDFTTASAFLLTYGTSYHALKDRAQLQSAETLLVLGAAGGVGLAAVEIGKSMGARVIAAASSDEKLAVARERGADELINYATEKLTDRVMALTDGHGAHGCLRPIRGGRCDAAVP